MMNKFAILRAIHSGILVIACTITVIGQQSSAGSEKLDQTTTGNISGVVVNENGQPVANAAVFVRASGAKVQGNTRTDREGKFQVNGLDPAAYYVSASAPAYTASPRNPDSDQPNYYRIGDSVRVELIKGGVITGSVTSPTGEPVVGVAVRAHFIRDVNTRPVRYSMPVRERSTDDRGVYRIYGLPAGTYVVSAGGSHIRFLGSRGSAYDFDVATFAPSATRDAASELNVRAGEETNNVDIRYRGEPGHIVSGLVRGASAGTSEEYTVFLSSVFNGESQYTNYSYQSPGSQGFAFYGVADGDYYLTAQLFAQVGHEGLSEHRRIKVRGADVTGIQLLTKPFGSISGHLVLQESNSPECKDKRRPVFAETSITPWHNEKNLAKDLPRFQWLLGTPRFPDKQGEFTLRNLAPGQYRFSVRTFAKYWYLQSISLPTSTASADVKSGKDRTVDAARNWTAIKSGEKISDLNVTLAAGAASLLGRIKLSEAKQAAAGLFVYLAPAERERADDVLRFFAARVGVDGTFALDHLPPGRYRVLARVEPDYESTILSRLRLPDEVEVRARLRREAAASQVEVELNPCQNLTDFQLPVESALISVPK